MKKINLIFRKYECYILKLIEVLKCVVAVCSIASIVIIQLTEWRPFVVANRCEAINAIILNLSYSYLAAIFFHVVMVFVPGLYRKRIIRRQITCDFAEISIYIKQCIRGVYMYDLNHSKTALISRKKFVQEFCEKDLTTTCDYLTLLNRNISKISTKVDFLLGFKDELTDSEINILLTIKGSAFLTELIRPKDYIEDEHGNIHQIPNSNQREIATSIYYIYKLLK